MGLNAAREAGVDFKPEVWTLARSYLANGQKPDRSWAYTPASKLSKASMTCDGISSLIVVRCWGSSSKAQESLTEVTIHNCGKNGGDIGVQAGIGWLADHFDIRQNFGIGQEWKFYYLCALERAGRLTGLRCFGRHDWYQLGSDELIKSQDKLSGFWRGAKAESDQLLATCFAILFLGNGRTPVLINKLGLFSSNPTSKRIDRSGDWFNHADDVHNLCEIVARDWKRRLTWQVVDSRTATAADLLRAPILFISGHNALAFAPAERKNLRDYVEHGGTIFAEACCGSAEFDRSYKAKMAEIFVESEHKLNPLSKDHPIWSVKHRLHPGAHWLWGIQFGGRTAVIYSPTSLSCYWNQAHRDRSNPAVIQAVKVGQNLVEYATGASCLGDERVDR